MKAKVGHIVIAVIVIGLIIPSAYADEKIPDWVKNIFLWYGQDMISEDELIGAIKFLVNEGVIILDEKTTNETDYNESANEIPQSNILTSKLSISPAIGFEKHFTKYVNVFGISVYASPNTSDSKVLHAANVMAQYLDNDENGTADNANVVNELQNSVLVIFANEGEAENSEIWEDEEFHNLWINGQELYGDETNPNGEFDASLEEILHLITQRGYAFAYPEIFADNHSSEIGKHMDNARGGFFEQVPSTYPSESWYSYDDYTCDYSCMITEYFYWSLTSILGAQEDRFGEINHEWKLNTKQKVMEIDPGMYNLLTDSQYKLPTILPDGNYSPKP